MSPVSKKLGKAVERLRKQREKFRRDAIEKLNVVEPRGWSIDNLVGDALQHLG
jgi:hypothetical protein